MTLLRGTSITGVLVDRARAQADIVKRDLRNIASDQALAYELTTGKNAATAAGTGSPANAVHTHQEEANLLYYPWAMRVFASGNGDTWEFDAGSSDDDTFNIPFVIRTDLSTIDQTDILVQPVLFFVPKGWANRDVGVFIEVSGSPDPRMRFQLLDSSLAVVPGYENVTFTQSDDATANMLFEATPEDDFAVFAASFQAPTDGAVYLIKILTDLRTRVETRYFRGYIVMPTFSLNARNLTQPRMAPAGTFGPAAPVGDADNSHAWQPIDGALLADDGALGPAMMKIVENNNLTWEKAFGTPAPGNAATAVVAHRHDGADGTPELSRNVAAISFGSGYIGPEFSGSGSVPPVATTSFSSVAVMDAMMHYGKTSTTVVAADSSLKFACFIQNSDPAARGQVEAKSTDSGASSTTVNYTATVGTDTIITSSATFRFTSGGLTTLGLRFKDTIKAGASVLMAACWYYDP